MTATMQDVRRCAVVMALVGSIVGSAAYVVAENVRPENVFEMDRHLPGRVITGVYSPETVDGHSFAWTSERALLNVQGADRRMPWVCAVRFRGARAAGQPQPEVSLVHEGQVLAQQTASNEYASLQVTVPPRRQRSLRLNLVTSTTFVPGPSDPRQLGVQLDRWECAPEAGHLVMPPVRSIANAALTAAILGTLFAFAAAGAGWAAAGTLLLAVVQSLPWSIGVAPYTTYGDRAVRLAVGIALAAAAGAWLAARRQPLTSGARFAIAFSAAALFLKLAMLLHPSKAVIDGLFHAHRYDYVRGGHYFFTQGLPGGVEFPYSIALYVFAAPWGPLMRDHVALLRIVVSASEAVAGLLLYWALVRSWRDGSVAALAVVLFHLLPVSYWVIGNANLTQAFGQQAALATMSALIVWRLGPRDWIQVFALAALAAIAFLSHVSTFMLLGPTMIAAAAVTWWRGGRDMFVSARSIVFAVAIALAAATGLYYGRPEFFEAYRSIVAARAEQGAITGAAPTEADVLATRLEEGAIPVMSPVARVWNAIDLTGDSLSWPIVALALIGVWRVAVRGPGDRLTWTLAAWGTVGALFCVLGIILPGGFGHQRQAMEFIVRSIYAVAPAIVVLAAVGAVWAWRAMSVTRFAAVALVALAVSAGGRLWVNWIR
jgi:hypothetical protein